MNEEQPEKKEEKKLYRIRDRKEYRKEEFDGYNCGFGEQEIL